MSDLLSLCKELVEANNGHDPLDVNECIRRIRDLLAQHPSDPKHLPPRDCLVLYEWPRSSLGAYWVHAQFRDNGAESTWSELCTADPIDPSRVITWRELPEVG